jgi:hypothetical protein
LGPAHPYPGKLNSYKNSTSKPGRTETDKGLSPEFLLKIRDLTDKTLLSIIKAMATLIAIPILSFLTILQSAVVSRLSLLQGTADLILLVIIAWALQEPVRAAWQWSIFGGLMVGFVSAIPTILPILTYLFITGVVLLVRRRIWETPILAMFALTLFGSLFNQVVTALILNISGTPLPILDTLQLIILPSVILNLILAAPIYAVIKDLAEWVYPEEIKI